MNYTHLHNLSVPATLEGFGGHMSAAGSPLLDPSPDEDTAIHKLRHLLLKQRDELKANKADHKCAVEQATRVAESATTPANPIKIPSPAELILIKMPEEKDNNGNGRVHIDPNAPPENVTALLSAAIEEQRLRRAKDLEELKKTASDVRSTLDRISRVMALKKNSQGPKTK